MTSRHEAGFFTTRRRWSRIKHSILAYYLVPWAEKVGSASATIYVVDPFAGAGRYGDASLGTEEEGSPVIAVRRAEAYESRHPGRRMEVICVEHNEAHFASLQSCIEASLSRPHLLRGEFSDQVGTITSRIGSAPALILLDPIGVKSIDAATCEPLLQRAGPSDVFIIVHFGVVHRIGGMLDASGNPLASLPKAAGQATTIDMFFGTSAWRPIAVDRTLSTEEKSARYLNVYFDSVLGKRYRYKCAYAVKDKYWGGTKYWLVHASAHRDGIELMNDTLVAVDDDLFLAARNVSSSSAFLPGMTDTPLEQRRERREQELRRRIVEVIKGRGGSATFGDVKNELFTEFFGRMKVGEYSKGVKRLVRDGALARTQRVAAKLPDSERVSLAK